MCYTPVTSGCTGQISKVTMTDYLYKSSSERYETIDFLLFITAYNKWMQIDCGGAFFNWNWLYIFGVHEVLQNMGRHPHSN